VKLIKLSLIVSFILGTMQIDATQKLPLFARFATWTLKSSIKTGIATAGITALVAYGENLKLYNDSLQTENVIYNIRQQDFLYSWKRIAKHIEYGVSAAAQNSAAIMIKHAKNLPSYIESFHNKTDKEEINSSLSPSADSNPDSTKSAGSNQ
jgi:hypothetical protein